MPKVTNDWEAEYYDALPDEIQEPELPAWFFELGWEDEGWAGLIDQNYAAAMAKGSDYRCDLESHIMRGCGIVYQPYAYERDSALVGSFIEEVFCVSHFAPNSRKGGVQILKEALNSQTPMVICVPQHLARQLQRLGFTYKGEIPQIFNQKLITKQVMVNKNTTDQHLNDLLNYYQGGANDALTYLHRGRGVLL